MPRRKKSTIGNVFVAMRGRGLEDPICGKGRRCRFCYLGRISKRISGKVLPLFV